MGRSRYQEGTVKLVGKKVKKWRGGWHSYSLGADGVEHRHHHSTTLGLKSEMTKDEAKRKLREHVDRQTAQAGNVRPNPDVTFSWFWTNNYLELKKGKWSEATRSSVESVIKQHFISVFGERKIGELKRLELQKHLYDVAAKWSESVAKKVRVYVKSALDEAVEQDYLRKNPARKLELGDTREPNKRNLSGDELCKIFNALTGEDHLILKIFVMTALRPGEEFALRWNDFDGDVLRIERAVKRVKKGKEKIGKPKTKKSSAKVYVPQSLQVELAHWKEIVRPKSDDLYIFPSRNGTPKDAHNYLRRHLKPLAEKLHVPGLTFQSLRRSFATLIQGKGTPKDVQTQMRHTDPLMALKVYTQPIPESVKKSVEALDSELQTILDTIGQESQGSLQ